MTQELVKKFSVHEISYIYCIYNFDSDMCNTINTTKTAQKISLSDKFLVYNWCYVAAEETC